MSNKLLVNNTASIPESPSSGEEVVITWEKGSLSSSTGAPKTSGSSWRFIDFVEVDTINFKYILKTIGNISYLHCYYYRDDKSYIGRTSTISTDSNEQEISFVNGARYIKMKGAPPSNAKMEDVLSIVKIRR